MEICERILGLKKKKKDLLHFLKRRLLNSGLLKVVFLERLREEPITKLLIFK